LLKNNYLKNYLISEGKLYKYNFIFILNLFTNNTISHYLIKKNFFLLINKFKLSRFFLKGNNYYFFFEKNYFIKNLYNLYEFYKIEFIFLNGVIYNNYYINLNNENFALFLKELNLIHYNSFLYSYNLIINIILYLLLFIIKLISLLKKRC
jgi:hypothetical protein